MESGVAGIVIEALLEIAYINLGDYVTKEYVINSKPDLTGYVLFADVQQLHEDIADEHAMKEDLPNLSVYVTKAEMLAVADTVLENLTNLEKLNY